jgi:hypothetical protein
VFSIGAKFASAVGKETYNLYASLKRRGLTLLVADAKNQCRKEKRRGKRYQKLEDLYEKCVEEDISQRRRDKRHKQ